MLTEKDTDKIVEKIVVILKSHHVTKDIKNLSNEECLIIINEIVECIKSSIDISIYLKDTPVDDKAGVILELIIEVLSSEKLESNISPEVAEQIRSLRNNTEAINILLKFVNYLNSNLLESLDNNNDGRVTIDEVESDIVDCLLCEKAGGCACYKDNGCCKCCPDFSKKIGKVLATIFIKVVCCGCGKNYVKRGNP